MQKTQPAEHYLRPKHNKQTVVLNATVAACYAVASRIAASTGLMTSWVFADRTAAAPLIFSVEPAPLTRRGTMDINSPTTGKDRT